MAIRIDSFKTLNKTSDVPQNPPLNFPKKREKIERLIAQYGWADKALLNQDLLNTAGYCDFWDFLKPGQIAPLRKNCGFIQVFTEGSTEIYNFIGSQFYIIPPEEHAFSTKLIF